MTPDDPRLQPYRVDVVGFDAALAELRSVRDEVFVGEQGVPITLEHDALIVALQSMQEHLGTLNDLATARTYWSRTLLPEPSFIAEAEAAHLSAAVVARAEVLDVPPFWE